MNLKNFQILILRSGGQVLQSIVTPSEYRILGSIISTFHSISELDWFKSEIIKAQKKNERTYTGLNNFECFVDGDKSMLKHEMDTEEVIIPTGTVLSYIDEAIIFRTEYESGMIPRVIPDSKKDEWVIVPNEYVKEEYWELMKNSGPEEA